MSETDSPWARMAERAIVAASATHPSAKHHVQLLDHHNNALAWVEYGSVVTANGTSQALGMLRGWLRLLLERAYKTGHDAGLNDLSRITAPVGTPLDEVADLRREVERLRAAFAEDKDRVAAEVTKAHEAGRLKGWREAHGAACAARDAKWAERSKAAEALAQAEKAAEVAGHEYHAAFDVVDAVREAMPKVSA